MIDFYIKIPGIQRSDIYNVKPSLELFHYKKYIKFENESLIGSIYIYTNCFYPHEHHDSLMFNENEVFFLTGKVYFRNEIRKNNENELAIEEVYGIIKGNKNFYKIIKGNFAYILIDRKTSQVELTNSPFGVIPINYAFSEGSLIISSSLSFIKSQLLSITINPAALLQVSMFDTILGNNTLIKEIEQLQYGQRILFAGSAIVNERYYDHTQFFDKKPISRKETITRITETLLQNSRTWPKNKPFLFGLTGGYDCRLNFAQIPGQDQKNIIAYTYGMSKSPEIAIAKKISAKYNLRHEIIDLGDDFEKEYLQNADEVLKLGDGFTPFMRVNYFYAHRFLSGFAHECITGMYGSELIKPMHVMEDSVTINPPTVKAFFSDDIIKEITNYFYELKNSDDSYFTDAIFSDNALKQTIEILNSSYITGKENLQKEQRIFNFYLNEGMRKFFMELIRIDKMFVDHIIPYLDIDFVELLLTSMYAGVNNHIFNESIIKRRKGQLLYADAMNKLNSDLNNIPVDRGYKPKYLRSEFGWLYITFGYFFGKKLRKILKGNTTFNTKKWRTMVYEDNQDLLKKESVYFKDNMYRKYRKGYHLNNEHVFGKHFSVKKWLEDNRLL